MAEMDFKKKKKKNSHTCKLNSITVSIFKIL